jgi:hypothetical protein
VLSRVIWRQTLIGVCSGFAPRPGRAAPAWCAPTWRPSQVWLPSSWGDRQCDLVPRIRVAARPLRGWGWRASLDVCCDWSSVEGGSAPRSASGHGVRRASARRPKSFADLRRPDGASRRCRRGRYNDGIGPSSALRCRNRQATPRLSGPWQLAEDPRQLGPASGSRGSR